MARGLSVRGVIARGSQGTVYLVHDAGLGRFLALKVIEVKAGESEAQAMADRVRRFASGEADPPVAILDLWVEGEAPAELLAGLPPGSGGPRILILMPLVVGPTLRELAEGDAAFGIVETACALAQISQRLRLLPAGLAHGDLKPENVLVDRGGRTFLIDPLSGLASGSPPYAAPEQREGEAPRPPADVHALATMGLVLLAGRFPKAGDPPGFLAPLREPPPNAPAELRRAFAALAPRLAAGRHPEEGRREATDELSRGLVEIAGGIAGPDLAAPLAASMGRATLPERFEGFTAAIAKEPRATSSNPLPQRGRGKDEGAKRTWPLVGGVALALSLLAGAAWWLRVPAPPPPALPPHLAACKVSPPARLLAPLEAAAPEHALFQETVVEPAGRVTLHVLHGPEVLSLDAPRVGDDCKIDLPPGVYSWEETYPNGKPDYDTVLLTAGGNHHDKTHPYVHSAPIDPNRRSLFQMVNPDDGPTVLFQGPLLLASAVWDTTAGTVAIAPHGSRCRGPTRALPQPSGESGSGDFDPWLQFGSGDDLCALPTASTPGGFGVHLEVTVHPLPHIDPAKRFHLDRKIKAIRGTSMLLEGPLFLTGASWSADAGTVKLAYGHCDNDFRDLLPPPTTDLPHEVENGRSVCAMPDPVHPGGTLTVHLEGYRP
jgi:serine/threonine protein kinase